MEITASILDYLGRYDDGILVSIGLMWKQKYYDGIFFYTKNKMIISVDESFTNDLGCYIEQHPDYINLLKSIILQCEPFAEIFDKLDNVEEIYKDLF
jgi:hypothetical protein